MSVVRQDPDLIDAFNELEAKVLCLQEEQKTLRRRLILLEKIAKKHGVNIDNVETLDVDTCRIV